MADILAVALTKMEADDIVCTTRKRAHPGGKKMSNLNQNLSEIVQVDKGALALQLFEEGAVKFSKEGFTLKMHELHPEAPKSPFYFNLRGYPKGTLGEETLNVIGAMMALQLSTDLQGPLTEVLPVAASKTKAKPGSRLAYAVGLPKAGEPLAEAFVQAWPHDAIILMKMEKEEGESGRRMSEKICDSYERNCNVLILDDLATGADTKIEAINSLRNNNFFVDQCVVLIDRQQGAEEQLKKVGVKLHSVFSLAWLLEYYLDLGLINQGTIHQIDSYKKEINNYLPS